RHLVELGDGRRIRRLVTLGSPYYSERRPARELAILATYDPLVPPPADGRGRVVVVEDCGHLNLLRHPAVLHAVARFPPMPVAAAAPEVRVAARPVSARTRSVGGGGRWSSDAPAACVAPGSYGA